jgi:hypothetical protein
MSPTKIRERPTETETLIPPQRTVQQLEEIEVSLEKPPLPEPGLGDFDLERARSRLTNVARLSGYLVLGPRIPVRRR